MIYTLADILTDLVYFWYYKVWRYSSNIVIGVFYQFFSKEYKKTNTGTVIESNPYLHYLVILGDDGKEYQVLRNTYFIYLKNFNNLNLGDYFKINDRVTFNKTHIKHRISVDQQTIGIKQQVINIKKINEKDDIVETFEGEIDFIEQYSETKKLKEYVAFRFFIHGEEKIISLDYNQTVFQLKIDNDLSNAKYGDKVIAKINTSNMMILDLKLKKEEFN